MNEEEAIENVKKQLEGIKKANECGLATRGEFNKDIEAIETVLNLLEKKDKESHFIQSELDIANAKIIELNKIIDLMTKELSKFDYSQYCNVTNCNYPPCNKEKCIKQYFERKVENVYTNEQ